MKCQNCGKDVICPNPKWSYFRCPWCKKDTPNLEHSRWKPQLFGKDELESLLKELNR